MNSTVTSMASPAGGVRGYKWNKSGVGSVHSLRTVHVDDAATYHEGTHLKD
jgi:hypothetical protein